MSDQSSQEYGFIRPPSSQRTCRCGRMRGHVGWLNCADRRDDHLSALRDLESGNTGMTDEAHNALRWAIRELSLRSRR